jgi:hypothetical protein
MKKRTEKQIAKGAYSWLRGSPILTVFTFYFLISLDLGSGSCEAFSCSRNTSDFINFLIGILGSSLWHLLLLQYVNNKESDFVRWHGRQALALAGIRTIVPIAFLSVDYALESDGCLFAWVIPVLIILWLVNTPWGNRQVDGGICWLAQRMGRMVTPPLDDEKADPLIAQNLNVPSKVLLAELMSDDAVTRITALMKLNSVAELRDDIRREIESMAVTDENEDARKDAQLLLEKFVGQDQQKLASLSNQAVDTEDRISVDAGKKPAEVLNEILNDLQSAVVANRLRAIKLLHSINYSSEAIRNELEKLAINSDSPAIRKNAFAALDLPTQRNVRSRSNTLTASNRFILLNEINEWENTGLLDNFAASVLRKRYDFDATPTPPAVKPAAVQPALPTSQAKPIKPSTAAATPMKASQPVQLTTSQPVATKEVAGPKPTVPSKPKQPAVDWNKVRQGIADAASSGALLRALLYLGAFMIVISATVLVVRFWNVFNPVLQLLFISSVPMIFYFGGWALRTRLKLIQAGTVLTGIGAILVAVDFAAIYQLGGLAGSVNSSGYWFIVAIVCTALYAFTAWKIRGEFFDYLTLIACAGIIFTFTRLLKFPIEWSVASVTASAAIMAGAATRFWQPGQYWHAMAQAARYLSQILIPSSIIFIMFSNKSLPIMAAFLFATIAYGLLAWTFPSVVFAYSSLGASIGTVLFALRAADMSPQWYGTVGSTLALAYILLSQLVKRAKLEAKIIQSYITALKTTGLILVGLAVIDAVLISFDKNIWPGIIALTISSLDLAVCAYLFQRSRYTLLAAGLVLVPFTLAIGRWLNDAHIAQGLTWLTVAWGALALIYIVSAALLRKVGEHARWLYIWAHVLIPVALFFIYFDYLTTDAWVNTSALISLGICIAGYLTTFILQDSGKHESLSAISNWLPSGLGKSIFLWPIGLLLPLFSGVAWYGTRLTHSWFGTVLTGFALAYLAVGQLLYKRVKAYRLPLHVFVYLLCLIAIPWASPARYALLTALLISAAAAGVLAFLYNRVVETTIASVLFIWPFQSSLEILKISSYSQSLGYVLLAGIAYIPLAIYIKSVNKNNQQNHHTPIFTTGYAMTVYAMFTSVAGRTSEIFVPWVGVAVPLIATALYIFSTSYFKDHKDGIGWAWAGTLTLAIACGQALTLFKIPAQFEALTWIGLAFAYMIGERLLAQIPELGLGKIERDWFNKFHWPLITGILIFSVLGLGLSLPDTFATFAGRQPANILPAISAQLLLVLLAISSARLYQERWPLFIEPLLAFLPLTLFFIGYGEKIFQRPLTTPQYALVWTGLGAIHLLAGALLDRVKVRYAHGLHLGAYVLLTWAALWSVIDQGVLVWSLGLWILALITSAILVHFGRHHTWDEFNELLFGKAKGALPTSSHNLFQWLAAWAFPIWLVLLLRQIHVLQDFTWLGLVVPPLAYLGLAVSLQKFDSAYATPLRSSGQFYTVIGLLISAPATIEYLPSLNGAISTHPQLAWIILQIIAVLFYAASAWTFRSRGFAHISGWLSIIPFTVAWNSYGLKFTPISLVIPWLIWSTILLTVGFVLDKIKVRYAHGPYLAGYTLAIFTLANSAVTRLTNIYALAITILLAVASHLLVHFGRHHSFEDFVNRFWKKAPEVTQQIIATGFLFFASYAAPVLLAQILTYLKLDLAVRGVTLAIAAPLFIAIGLAVRSSKSRSIATVPTWPLYSTGYALTAIGAMISFGDERLAIYVLLLNIIVYAVSAYIFQQAFWLYLATTLTPISALLILHNLDRFETKWVAWIFIGLAYLYVLIGQVFDRTKTAEGDIHPFAAPVYVPGFLLSAVALAISSWDKMLALQVYSAGVVLYGLTGWLFQEPLFIYPASWLATVPYYLLITFTPLETRWYGLAWLPLIIVYIALGRFVFHKRPLPPLGSGVLADWLSHPATPFYLLAYSLSVSMISLSYVSPLSLTLAFAAAAVVYFISAYLFLAPSWIYAGLLATHMTVLAFFLIHPSGKPAQYITFPFLAMTWLTALAGYGFSPKITETDSQPPAGPAKAIKKEAFRFSLINHLFGRPWSRPFFGFAIAEMFIWQTVAAKGYDTTIVLGSGHALLLALFSFLWMEGALVYGVVGFSLLVVGTWMRQSGIAFNDAIAIYGGIGLGLYLLARLVEPISARIKSLTVWLTPLTYSAVALTAASAIINLPFVVDHMTAAAASLAFAGALYVAIAYRGRRYQLGYLGMALLEISWVMALFMNDVKQPQWYAIPGGLYFMGLAYLEWQRNRSRYAIAIELLGLGILLITSFTQSLQGTQGFAYFVLLMVEALLILGWGTIQKRKIPFFTGIGFTALNFIAQVILLVNVGIISIWYVGLGAGLLIVGIAGFVELRREQLQARIGEWSETLETWE